ncbi:MAG TPA: LamG-like jellyroll fold domain-containing protein [Gemmataceae bacterium]|nr:LamG-like jellyroll fold domain-containing protein [Gemmataceae bacterium]
MFKLLLLLTFALLLGVASLEAQDASSLKKALSFYASFDESLDPEVGVGEIKTRFGDPNDPSKFTFEDGFNKNIYKIARGKGIAGGGCLEATDVLPNRGRWFYPVKGNLAYQKGGWGGALSMWINMDPAALKLQFCDPVQITQKGANNGGIWFDFNDAKPRDLRMGVFPAVPAGAVGAKETDADAPMVRVPKVAFKAGEWHHVVLSWSNFDSGKKDAHATLFIDGKKVGDVKDRAIAMDWDIEKAGIFTAVGYTGLIDEMACFNRALTADEVTALHKTPGLLAAK